MHVFSLQKRTPSIETLCDYLRLSQVDYHIIDLLDNELPLEKMGRHSQLLRCVLLQEEKGLFMAIIPQAGLLDLGLIQRPLLHPVMALDENIAPLSEYYGISAILDKQILFMETVYFKATDANILIGMSRESFVRLQHNARFGHICVPMHFLLDPTLLKKVNPIVPLTPMRMKQRVKSLLNLPIFPSTTGKLLQLRVQKNSPISQLIELIEKDPSLSLQVLSWVQSPKVPLSRSIHTIEEAIHKVLGADLALNLALMTGISETLKMPKEGKLGWEAYWESALYAGYLSKNLSKIIHPFSFEKQQQAYFSGFFHNIGLLILSEVFPSYYGLLNELMVLNNHLSVPMVEQYTFGVTHYELAVNLMKAWFLPKEMISALDWHQSDPTTLISEDAKIVRLATHLLATADIGEGLLVLPESLSEELGLSLEKAHEALDGLLDKAHLIHRLMQ